MTADDGERLNYERIYAYRFAGIDQGAFVMLAMDFDQRAAQRFDNLHAHRLIVDKGARAPVGKLHAA